MGVRLSRGVSRAIQVTGAKVRSCIVLVHAPRELHQTHLDAHRVDATQRVVDQGHCRGPEGLSQDRVLDAVQDDAGGEGAEVVPPRSGGVALG